MRLNEEFLKELLENYFQRSLSYILPTVVRDVVSKNTLFLGQDFIPLKEVTRRYQLSRRTIYNYHSKKYITLYTSEGKTFLSVRELESHIKNNPLPRKA